MKAFALSLGILGATALVQLAIFLLSASVALLADLIARGTGSHPGGPASHEPGSRRRRKHARVDGFVSLGVVLSAIGLWAGAEIADPIVGLLITLVILRIAWDPWQTVTRTDPGGADFGLT